MLLIASTGLAQPYSGHGMMGWGHGWGWPGVLMMIVFWVAVVLGILALIRWLWMGGAGRQTGRGGSHLDILKERYARGEINKEEFEQKKKDLGG